MSIKTVITRDINGAVGLIMEGDSAPEAVTREYQKVELMLFPEAEEKKPAVKEKKEVTQ